MLTHPIIKGEAIIQKRRREMWSHFAFFRFFPEGSP